MGKLQILPYVLVMLFPWFAVISYIDSPFGGAVMVEADLIILLILCVWCNKSAVNGESNKKSVVMNLVTKIYYIRIVYRVFGFGAVPVICIFLTGFCNIGNCIRLYRDGSCKRFTSIILGIMGFIYGLDITGGIIQICLANKSTHIKTNFILWRFYEKIKNILIHLCTSFPISHSNGVIAVSSET